jgi:hypothetical protein
MLRMERRSFCRAIATRQRGRARAGEVVEKLNNHEVGGKDPNDVIFAARHRVVSQKFCIAVGLE